MTSGIVSGLDRTIDGRNGKLTGLLQTDAAINPGNSGGPLVDRLGRLVGINTAGVRLAEAENVSFAIAIDGALPVIERIRNETPATEAWLGIAFNSVDSDAAAVQLGLDASVRGAAVTVVYPGGPGRGRRPGRRRRDHRRRRRPDRLRRRPRAGCSPRASPATSSTWS